MKTIAKALLVLASIMIGAYLGTTLGKGYLMLGHDYLGWDINYNDFSYVTLFIIAAMFTVMLIVVGSAIVLLIAGLLNHLKKA